MEKFFRFIIEHKKTVIVFFLAAAVLCGLLALNVRVNYNLVDYLPEDSQSTKAIEIMKNDFEGNLPNARVMLKNVTMTKALEFKEKLSAIPGVSSVSWLDDLVGLDTLRTTPLEFLDSSLLVKYYKENTALFTLTIQNGMESEAVNAIYELIGENNAAAGGAVNIAATQEMAVTEVAKAMAILLPVTVIILIISTSSWIEPLLFLATIGIAVIINLGTNVIYDDISFITMTVSPILQIAVSMDYAIFLLHSFANWRKEHSPEEAMLLAMKKSLPTVAASAATTVIGFAALIFMRFGIGADLGMNLLKGVSLSFISVMIFLPALTLVSYKVIDKTRHRSFMPSFKKPGKALMKLRLVSLILVLAIVLPAYLAQSKVEFQYGTGDVAKSSRAGKDASAITSIYGQENVLVLLLPRNEQGREKELCNELVSLPRVTEVVSYDSAVGGEIPMEIVPEEVRKQFYSDDFSRIVIYTDMAEEGEDSFNTIQAINSTVKKYYDSHYLAGQSATLYDMKNTVSADNRLVSLLAIGGIFLVLLITFKSPVISLILLFTIETAIWLNLSIPYFSGNSLNFVGYLIINTVQLGATVDYAILMTNAYISNRSQMEKQEAMQKTLEENLPSVLTSAAILSTAGFALALSSSNKIIIDLGNLMGRGTLFSLGMVALVLPALLLLGDVIIRRQAAKRKEMAK